MRVSNGGGGSEDSPGCSRGSKVGSKQCEPMWAGAGCKRTGKDVAARAHVGGCGMQTHVERCSADLASEHVRPSGRPHASKTNFTLINS